MREQMTLRPLDASFGAEITGIELPRLDDQAFEQLRVLWLEYALLIFPGQHLSIADQNAFARRFGPLEFEAAPLSNLRRDGSLRADDGSDDMVAILRGNMEWHADSTYMPLQARGAVFSAHRVPSSGGETQWADMRAAFDALDAATRERIDGLTAHHSLKWSQARSGHAHDVAPGTGEYSGYGLTETEAPLRPLVKVHPETERRSLLIGRHAHAIEGLDAAASERLLDDLLAHACRAPRLVTHRWQQGDTVLWDNRCLLHRGRPWDMAEPRIMYHTRIAGDPVSEAALDRNTLVQTG